jgi:hypothetical protein
MQPAFVLSWLPSNNIKNCSAASAVSALNVMYSQSFQACGMIGAPSASFCAPETTTRSFGLMPSSTA